MNVTACGRVLVSDKFIFIQRINVDYDVGYEFMINDYGD